RGYKQTGMPADSRLQQKEFEREAEYGYEAVKHQRFVGPAYFDALTQVIAGGSASTTALQGSTEKAQFAEIKMPVHAQYGTDGGCRPSLGECPSIVSEIAPPNEEILLPSGD